MRFRYEGASDEVDAFTIEDVAPGHMPHVKKVKKGDAVEVAGAAYLPHGVWVSLDPLEQLPDGVMRPRS